MIAVKQKSLTRIIRTIQPIRILKLLHVQSEDDHGVDVPDFVIFRKRKHRIRLLCHPVI